MEKDEDKVKKRLNGYWIFNMLANKKKKKGRAKGGQLIGILKKLNVTPYMAHKSREVLTIIRC